MVRRKVLAQSSFTAASACTERVELPVPSADPPFRSTEELLQYLGLSLSASPYALARTMRYATLVPRDFASRMRPGDWYDPLLLQVLPRAEENRSRPGFSRDPVCDHAAMVAPGLLHKYHGRVLVLTTTECAVHCRYCFRRAFSFAEKLRGTARRRRLWRYIAARTDITEVVLSGGDPLTLGPERLRCLLRPVWGIPHVRIVRIHSRVPVADPQRIDRPMLSFLGALARRFTLVVVIHANCAQELTGCCADAIGRLRRAGAVLLNQSVLLARVNDTADALEALSRQLLACGVLPYYLHQLDRAQGTWHFEVPPDRGIALTAELRRRLPGYLVPRYVRDIPGRTNKALLEKDTASG